jgi:hypothetical protein
MSKINGIGTEIKMHFVVTVNIVFISYNYCPSTSYTDIYYLILQAEILISKKLISPSVYKYKLIISMQKADIFYPVFIIT